MNITGVHTKHHDSRVLEIDQRSIFSIYYDMADYKPILSKYFKDVCDTTRHPLCPGYLIVSFTDNVFCLLPQLNFDYDTHTNKVFVKTCNHRNNECSLCVEYEYFLLNQCIKGKYTPEFLHSLRPLNCKADSNFCKHLITEL